MEPIEALGTRFVCPATSVRVELVVKTGTDANESGLPVLQDEKAGEVVPF